MFGRTLPRSLQCSLSLLVRRIPAACPMEAEAEPLITEPNFDDQDGTGLRSATADPARGDRLWRRHTSAQIEGIDATSDIPHTVYYIARRRQIEKSTVKPELDDLSQGCREQRGEALLAREDDPDVWEQHTSDRRAPRAPGVICRGLVSDDQGYALPAHAGMIRAPSSSGSGRGRAPRVRGG